jgi:hypothetical protein
LDDFNLENSSSPETGPASLSYQGHHANECTMTDLGIAAGSTGLKQSAHPEPPMTTSEQMYFLGAPVAHILAYQERFRRQRQSVFLRPSGRRAIGAYRMAGFSPA